MLNANIKKSLQEGIVIPAHPLALTEKRKLDERRQRALSRYYIAAGSGGLAVGVHTTQFEIRQPEIGLFKPVLILAKEEMDRADATLQTALIRIAGICGNTHQAIEEAELVSELKYHAGLLSLAAMKTANDDELIAHCKKVANVIPIVGFYLQPAVGGRVLSYNFWRRFAEIENVVAIKMAPFHRYRTLDVIRAVADAGRDDIALYTGNDDNIIMDLLTPYRFIHEGKAVERHIVGGLLGHWAVWTHRAVEHLKSCREITLNNAPAPMDLLKLSIEITDCNAAFFDVQNNFTGCIAGIHEVLLRQGLLAGRWCLNPTEELGPGQMEEIDRIYDAYPHLNDDEFVAKHRDEWLKG